MRKLGPLWTYTLLTLGFVGAMVLVLVQGIRQFGGAGGASFEGSPWTSFVETLHTPLALMLLQVIVIVLVARAAGQLFALIHQPPVIGEMFAGIALGPSLVGSLFPQFSAFVFPKESLTNLGLLSQVGVILFMFVVGMELDTRMLRQKAQTAILVSHTSIFLPFLLGLASALFLFKNYSGTSTHFLPFALFMGISMSITAFPVLARIIQDRGLTGTQLGNTAITCAAVDDITAWCSLAFIVAIAKSQTLAGSFLTVLLSLVIVVVVFGLVRPALQKMSERLPDPAQPGRGSVMAALLTVFLCALATEAAGIHALFGAFIAGVAMPKSEQFRHFVRERLEYFSTLFLLPIFFAFTGLRTHLGLLEGGADWLVFGYLLFIAVGGKLGGSAIAARLSGVSWRESLALGALMNTRGLMELIALNLGLDLGVLSPKIFAMLVLMALITTFSTGPIVSWLGYGQGLRSKVA